MERISSFFLMGHAQRRRTSVFVLMLISTFIGKNKECFFMHVLKKDVLLLCA
jgi:hypothetical protein